MERPESVPTQIENFSVFPLVLPPLPSFPHPATHYLYVSPHQPKVPSPTASRSLFLANVPFDSTDVHFKHLFSTQLSLPAGRIEDVQFEDSEGHFRERRKKTTAKPGKGKKKRDRTDSDVLNEEVPIDQIEGCALPKVWDRDLHQPGSTAVILFVDRASAEAALKAVKSAIKHGKEVVWGEEKVEGSLPPLGLERYIRHEGLIRPSRDTVLKVVNNYMNVYNEREAATEQERARKRQEPDADGFVTVTRGGRANTTSQEAAKAQVEKKKDKQKGLDDFYRFQFREKRKEHAKEVLRKFEKDKQKIRDFRAKKHQSF